MWRALSDFEKSMESSFRKRPTALRASARIGASTVAMIYLGIKAIGKSILHPTDFGDSGRAARSECGSDLLNHREYQIIKIIK
jgi:hypothetical protein